MERIVRLIPRTKKGRERIAQAGTDLWSLSGPFKIQARPELCFRAVPTDPNFTHCWRWISERDDPDFEIDSRESAIR